MNVTYQHDRIQSMYVGIAMPAIDVGYSVVTSNGSTCVTGSTKYSYFCEELSRVVIQLGLARGRAGDVGAGVPFGFCDLPLHGVLHQVGMLARQRGVARVIREMTQMIGNASSTPAKSGSASSTTQPSCSNADDSH